MKHLSVLILLVASLLCCNTAIAQEISKPTKAEKREKIKQHAQQHFKFYGFVRNYFSYDSRENVAGTGDLFNYLPKDNAWNQTEAEALASGVERIDLNEQSSFRFLSLTTRVGVDVIGYKFGNTEMSAKIEADFYAGLTGLTGTAQLRLRQAYVTLAWDSLRMNDKDVARVSLLMGQTWHPLAQDMPEVISLNTGSPFNPFARTPQVKMDARLGRWFTLTASALWQMQYTSAGPEGASANYIKYSCTPEAYLGLSFQHKCGILARAGVDVLSISPRHIGEVEGENGNIIKVKVNDRITTASPFLYVQYKTGGFMVSAKTVFAEAGEHLNLNGGYGVSKINEDGSWEYTPSRNSSTYLCLSYGGDLSNKMNLKGILFGGYVKNFGTKDELVSASNYYFSKNSFTNLNQLWRLSPTILWTIGKFQLGCEYEITSAQYGDGNINLENGLSEEGLHWVTNHKVQAMVKYNF